MSSLTTFAYAISTSEHVTPKRVTTAEVTPKRQIIDQQVTATEVTSRQVTPRQDTSTRVTPTRVTPTQVTPTQVTPRQDTSTRVAPTQVTPRQDTSTQVTPRQDTPKRVTATQVTPQRAKQKAWTDTRSANTRPITSSLTRRGPQDSNANDHIVLSKPVPLLPEPRLPDPKTQQTRLQRTLKTVKPMFNFVSYYENYRAQRFASQDDLEQCVQEILHILGKTEDNWFLQIFKVYLMNHPEMEDTKFDPTERNNLENQLRWGSCIQEVPTLKYWKITEYKSYIKQLRLKAYILIVLILNIFQYRDNQHRLINRQPTIDLSYNLLTGMKNLPLILEISHWLNGPGKNILSNTSANCTTKKVLDAIDEIKYSVEKQRQKTISIIDEHCDLDSYFKYGTIPLHFLHISFEKQNNCHHISYKTLYCLKSLDNLVEDCRTGQHGKQEIRKIFDEICKFDISAVKYAVMNCQDANWVLRLFSMVSVDYNEFYTQFESRYLQKSKDTTNEKQNQTQVVSGVSVDQMLKQIGRPSLYYDRTRSQSPRLSNQIPTMINSHVYDRSQSVAQSAQVTQQVQPTPNSASQSTPKLAPVIKQPVQSAPVTQQPAPVTQQPAPVIQQSAPVTQQPAPVIKQPVQSAPVTQQPAPVFQQSAPVIKQPVQSAPVTQQSAPVTQQSAPVTQQSAPVTQQPAPVTQQPAQPAPVAQQPEQSAQVTQQLTTPQPAPPTPPTPKDEDEDQDDEDLFDINIGRVLQNQVNEIVKTMKNQSHVAPFLIGILTLVISGLAYYYRPVEQKTTLDQLHSIVQETKTFIEKNQVSIESPVDVETMKKMKTIIVENETKLTQSKLGEVVKTLAESGMTLPAVVTFSVLLLLWKWKSLFHSFTSKVWRIKNERRLGQRKT